MRYDKNPDGVVERATSLQKEEVGDGSLRSNKQKMFTFNWTPLVMSSVEAKHKDDLFELRKRSTLPNFSVICRSMCC